MEKRTLVCGVQQVGVGVYNVVEAYNWYIRAFGCDIMVTDAKGVAERMLPYTGGKPRPRRAVLAFNLQGGGGFEIWQPLDNHITPPSSPVCFGDYGISVSKVKAKDIEAAYNHIKSLDGATLLTQITTTPYGPKHFYMTDPYDNMYEIVEDDFQFKALKGYHTGGTHGAVIGVSDMDASIHFYSTLLGYDRVIYDAVDLFEDLRGVRGAEVRMRRVIIAPSSQREGAFADMFGTACLELVQLLEGEPKKIFEGRWWGDPGFIQICFDVVNMEGMRQRALSLDRDFVCDGGVDFKMGDADGHFTYVEDPDGTLIELVETYKVPIKKDWGLALDLKKRKPGKKLPRWIISALKFLRVSGIK